MHRPIFFIVLAAATLLFAARIEHASAFDAAAEADRDFSGHWILDAPASNTRELGPVDIALNVSQGDAGLLVSTGTAQWSYALDGSETRKKNGEESRSSLVKWEGSALLINTIVSGPQDFTVMDRWTLSRDHNTLTVRREISRNGTSSEGVLVYRREGVPAATVAPVPPPASQPVLARRPEPGQPPAITVPTGTHVLLRLTNELSTKHAKDGDHVYLRTDAPVAIDGRVVIPNGSYVEGTVTHAKPAGHIAGKGELYIRFDSLILPNGIQRDFKARPPRSEGAVDGDRKVADGRDVLMGAGMGAGVGAIASGIPGAAIGGGIGALAGVLLSRQQDVKLPAGTHLEMVLDRDLIFTPGELMP